MNNETIEGIQNLIKARSGDLRQLDMAWYGGEPLAAYDVILDVMRYTKTALRGDTKLISSITTNGYLLIPEKARELVQVGFTNFQVTFDGDRDKHDLLRRRADGSGTFDRIWSNILDLHRIDEPFEMVFRIHVNSENVNSIKALLGRVKRELGGDKRFRIWLYPLTRLGLGNPNDDRLPFLKEHKESPVMKILEEEANSLGLEHLDKEQLRICPSAKLNQFVIRSDGRIGKCTTALEDERNTVGKLRRDGTMEIDADKLVWWGRGLVSRNERELNCPLRG